MSTQHLQSGTVLKNSDGAVGLVLGRFIRKGEAWWTVHWEDLDTAAHKELDICESMEILSADESQHQPQHKWPLSLN